MTQVRWDFGTRMRGLMQAQSWRRGLPKRAALALREGRLPTGMLLGLAVTMLALLAPCTAAAQNIPTLTDLTR